MIEYWKNLSLENLFYIAEDGRILEEEWRDVPNYISYYQASNLGRVKSLERTASYKHKSGKLVVYRKKCMIMKQQDRGDGYLIVTLTKNSVQEKERVNQLIAIVFLNHTPCGYKLVVDHINNNPSDNRISNLQIITQKQNARKDKNPKSGNNNIYLESNKYRVKILINNKKCNFGSYKTLEEALHNRNLIYELNDRNEDVSNFIKKKNSSRCGKNIYLHQGKYRVRIHVNKKTINLPSFSTVEEAKVFLMKYKVENDLP